MSCDFCFVYSDSMEISSMSRNASVCSAQFSDRMNAKGSIFVSAVSFVNMSCEVCCVYSCSIEVSAVIIGECSALYNDSMVTKSPLIFADGLLCAQQSHPIQRLYNDSIVTTIRCVLPMDFCAQQFDLDEELLVCVLRHDGRCRRYDQKYQEARFRIDGQMDAVSSRTLLLLVLRIRFMSPIPSFAWQPGM